MVKKQAVAKSTMATLESVIRRGAERYKIDQVCASSKALQLQTKINKVNWYPIAHTSTTIPAAKDFFKVGIVISGASVLSSRQVYLQRGAYCQEYLSREQERWLHKERQRLPQSGDRKAGPPSQKSNKKKGPGKKPKSNRIAQQKERENINRKQNGQKDTKKAPLFVVREIHKDCRRTSAWEADLTLQEITTKDNKIKTASFDGVYTCLTTEDETCFILNSNLEISSDKTNSSLGEIVASITISYRNHNHLLLKGLDTDKKK
ncbi:hypothetical protein O988_05223 [Pseudogymnoascus sp. VKM F-3808]|nr:hypothetical protein O988_05223 [Pseudogymnoascus sp. VKM F-3808]